MDIEKVRPEYVDWGMKSASLAIESFAGHLKYLLGEGELIPSEQIIGVEETTASGYSNETNRVLRVTADCEGTVRAFDVVVQYAAPTTYTYPHQ
ncbi:hypothetical protein [Streptomyces bluensis]|uniref:hypothetical protein n=1 Tax=Streptomyces bluensis TaxID=33897 RepID=UPI003323C79F